MSTEKTLKGYITCVTMNLNTRIYSRLNRRLLVQVGDLFCTQSRCGLGPILWANMSNISLKRIRRNHGPSNQIVELVNHKVPKEDKQPEK